MKKTEFNVRPDKKGVRLGDRFFYRTDEKWKQVMKDPDTGELVLLQQYEGRKLQQIDEVKKAVIRHFFPDHAEERIDADEEELEVSILDGLPSKRELKGLIYPFCYEVEPAEEERKNVYTVSELPETFTEKYRRIDTAVLLPEFSLRARVLAALNLSDTVSGIQKHFDGLLYSFSPEAVFVNIESGDVRILIERCMDPESKGKDQYVYGFSPGQGRELSEMPREAELLNFLEYATFRLLCVDDPFDGIRTLVRYPYLTKKALETIHKGEHTFIFSDGGRQLSAYTVPYARGRWKGLPGYLRRLFERVFTSGAAVQADNMGLAEWQKQMQKLRDCLVYVNRQFRLCDPEIPNKVLFMLIGEYQIPVWSKKAIYWYHVGVPYDADTGGIVGGIDAEGYLKNHTDARWVAEVDKKTFMVASGGKVKLEEGMKLTVAENVCIHVVSGEALPAAAADIGVSDKDKKGAEKE